MSAVKTLVASFREFEVGWPAYLTRWFSVNALNESVFDESWVWSVFEVSVSFSIAKICWTFDIFGDMRSFFELWVFQSKGHWNRNNQWDLEFEDLFKRKLLKFQSEVKKNTYQPIKLRRGWICSFWLWSVERRFFFVSYLLLK